MNEYTLGRLLNDIYTIQNNLAALRYELELELKQIREERDQRFKNPQAPQEWQLGQRVDEALKK